MKTNYISILVLLGFSLLFHSCEKEIEFSGKTVNPMLVVNSFLSPDSLIKVHVSKSKFFLKDNSSFEMVNNATVNVWVNGIKVEQLINIGLGYYEGSFKPKVGDIVKITATTSDFSEVFTETKILQAIPIIKVDTARYQFEENPILSYSTYNNDPKAIDTVGFSKHESFDFKIKFNDPKNESNFYRLTAKVIRYYDNDSIVIGDAQIQYNDLVFGGNNDSGPFETSGYNYYHEFSDELFNGKEYNLSVSFYHGTTLYKPEYLETFQSKKAKSPIRQELQIELQSISESYFLYLRSRTTNMTTEEFFSEPVQIYSNVKGGIGILGSYSSSVYKIKLF